MSSEKSAAITRIARRKALPGHEADYEDLVREMFTMMRRHHGFAGAELIPPTTAGGEYQVVVNFASESDLAAWDDSEDRRRIFGRMRPHAEGEPEHRRLNAMDEWFIGPSVPSHTKPPRWKTGIVTWMGIWPLASFFIFFLTPVWQSLGLPFLLITAINVALIVGCMTYLVAPVLTKAMRWFLVPKQHD